MTPEPKSAEERADFLMNWDEDHTIPSVALRDETIVQLRAYARQQVEAWKEQAVKATCLYCNNNAPLENVEGVFYHGLPTTARPYCFASILRALPVRTP